MAGTSLALSSFDVPRRWSQERVRHLRRNVGEGSFTRRFATISIAAAVGWLVNGVSQVVFGRMVDRFGGRIVVTIGLIVMGLGTASIAAVGNVYALIALYGVVVSFASGALSGGPPSVVAARWFRKSRGRALSTLASGGSVGGLVFVPFLTYLLIWTDWRTSWLIAGVIVLFLGAPVVYWCQRRPQGRWRISGWGSGQDGGRWRTGPDARHSPGGKELDGAVQDRADVAVVPRIFRLRRNDGFDIGPLR